MLPARRARGAVPPRPVLARAATGTLLVTMGAVMAGALTGCAAAAVGPAAPVAAPQGVVEVGDRPEPCRFLSQATVADLAGDQRAQIVGSANTCSFSIGGQFTYQINVQPDDTGRFESERDRFFKNSVPVAGVGDEAFFRDGTAITVLGARKGDTYFAVTLVPKISDPAGAGGAAPPVAGQAEGDQAQGDQNQAQGNQNQNNQAQDALADAADADGDGVVDADQDGDGQVDAAADDDAVAAADADGDGAVDDDVAIAVQNAGGANDAGANDAGANDAGANDAGANDAGANDGGAGARGVVAPVDDIIDAKARMTDVAAAVADSL
jgi:hypothetical protein